MELKSFSGSETRHKRKRVESEEDNTNSNISFEDLVNEDILERVLARLPPSTFFRCRSVCRKWNSVATSATFHLACSQLPTRDPWFFMVGSHLHNSIIFDSSCWNWRSLNHLGSLPQSNPPIPVAASGGLLCFRTSSGDFVVSNPVSSTHRLLPPIENRQIHAIAMKVVNSSYKVVVMWGDYPNLHAKTYDSNVGLWKEDVGVTHPRSSSSSELEEEADESGDNAVYFLSKAGDVVATDMQRSPSKQYSSVLTMEGEEEVIHFLSPSGAVVACNLTKMDLVEYPRLLPPYLEYSIDIVECDGEMMAVVLSDLLESSSLRVWRFCKGDRLWHQVASMPPWMSHELYGKKADVNCVGYRGTIVVCVSSSELNGCFACDLASNTWLEMPKCWVGGEVKEFMSAFSFEPRIEALV